MTEHKVFQAIWTPEDAAQTARDAAEHQAHHGETLAAEDMQPDPGARPFWRNANALCTCCGAWPLEQCEQSCLSRMTPEEQDRHRAEVLDGVLAYLDRLEAEGRPYSPPVPRAPGGQHRAPAGGMRPNRARMWEWIVALVSVVLILTAIVVL